MVVKEECSESITAMRKEIDELNLALESRDCKIQSLEAEIAVKL